MSKYVWEEILPETIPEVDWSQFTEEQMSDIGEMLDTHVSMTDEVYAYTVPSSSDMAQTRWYQKEQSLVERHKYETDWRDERIRELENKVRDLRYRIDRLSQ